MVSCYRPSQGDIKECQKYLKDTIEKIDLKKNYIFIIGDLNIIILDKKDKDVQNFATTLEEKGLL